MEKENDIKLLSTTKITIRNFTIPSYNFQNQEITISPMVWNFIQHRVKSSKSADDWAGCPESRYKEIATG